MAVSLAVLSCSPPPCSSRRLASPATRRSCLFSFGDRPVAAVCAASRPPDPVEVVGIGSRKDAVIDFCLGSRSLYSTPLRFWTIHMTDSSKVQLIQRCHGADMVIRYLEFPLSLHPCPPAIILVASAGHDVDDITAIELLNAVKSTSGLAVSIILKPFSFEGQRRQDEAADLIGKLQVCSNFHIVIEADSLLKTEVETLAEALESANNAVLLTISMISIMMSGSDQMFQSSIDGQIKDINHAEVGKLLKSYGEAKVGFGAGYNIQSAIKQAVFHCPFLRGGIKDSNHVVFVSLTSARILDENDMISTLHTIRQVTGFTREIIFHKNYEPDLEPKLIVITLLAVGPADSGLSSADQGTSSCLDVLSGDVDSCNASSAEKENKRSIRKSSNGGRRSQFESIEVDFEPDAKINKQNSKEPLGPQQEHSFWKSAPGFGIAQLWAKEQATINGGNRSDELDIFTLPVGVKSSELKYDSPNFRPTWPETSNATRDTSLVTESAAFGESFTDVGLERVRDIYNSAMTFLKGRNLDESRKRGSLAARASSMLEAERESEKIWTPIVEIRYRGGTYKGRCQEGVPEGKGRLIFPDGSFYDGVWRYGKRSGLGTLCYSNGDVFHGTWRDDLMHGKGWFYFHSGERWFANFWKGKANGEGRFYSKDGSIFFSHFQNGWRHGESLWIDANGSRWLEVWDEGVLVGRTKLEEGSS